MVAFFKPPFAAWGGDSTPDEDPEKDDEPENEDEDEPDINVSEPLELEPKPEPKLEPEPEPKLEPLPELEPPREIELKSPLPNVDEPEKDDPICWTARIHIGMSGRTKLTKAHRSRHDLTQL